MKVFEIRNSRYPYSIGAPDRFRERLNAEYLAALRPSTSMQRPEDIRIVACEFDGPASSLRDADAERVRRERAELGPAGDPLEYWVFDAEGRMFLRSTPETTANREPVDIYRAMEGDMLYRSE